MEIETSTRSWQSADDLIRAGADPAELRCHYHPDRLWDGTTPYTVPVCGECRDIADQTVGVWTDLIRADMDAATQPAAARAAVATQEDQ